MKHPDVTPSLVFADKHGNIRDLPDLYMAGMAGGRYFRPAAEDIIELPPGSELFTLPDRLPVGINPQHGEPLLVTEDPEQPGQPVYAVAAFMAPAHTATYNAAYQSAQPACRLPLFAYTAVGWFQDRFWVTGFRSDNDERQDTRHFNQEAISRKTIRMMKRHPSNRLIQHLATCCLTYHCPAAKNYFLGRWEAPLPSSPICNARCLGCISLQESGCCPSTQDRITFVPDRKELVEIAVPHLTSAPRPVVSFGQGCEGEPLLQADLLEDTIRTIRRTTSRGTINCNSNASLPEAIDRLAHAGLDSLRVSLNSARERYYVKYYRPRGYIFADVKQSIMAMKRQRKFVSLNYFILPGFTDAVEEAEAFIELVQNTGVDYIQLRNLNIDPEYYLDTLNAAESSPLGMRAWLELVKKRIPNLRFGYYNPPLNSAERGQIF